MGRLRRSLLEVQSQVRGDDGDVHEVDHMLMLSPVEVLVDIQLLRVRQTGIRSVKDNHCTI